MKSRLLVISAGALMTAGFLMADQASAWNRVDVAESILVPAPAPVDPAKIDGTFHPSQVLVRLNPGTNDKQRDVVFSAAGVLSITTAYTLVPDLYCVSVADGNVDAVIANLNKSGIVKYAERDYIRYTMAQSVPYGIDMVNAPPSWVVTRGSGTKVAVLDTGVDLTHPDLPQPVLSESFIAGQTVQDNHNHGTHCSGTVLGVDNTIGVVGVAPQASLMTGKVLSNSGSGPTSGVMSGVQWATANGAHVISMSLGGGGFDQSFQDICQAAVDANVVVVAAAGNSNSASPSYPGAYPAVICVAACDSNKIKASFSNFGPHVDVTAPGVGVQSTISQTTPAGTPTIEWNGVVHTSGVITGSATLSVFGQAIYCGIGNPADFPPEVAGKIAHIRRGGQDQNGTNLSFIVKTNNAIAAGAIGVIVSNNVSGNIAGTLQTTTTVPVVTATQAEGDELQAANPPFVATITIPTGAQYAFFNGTSMATPHVAGVAALVRASAAPRIPTAAQVRQAIEETCEDLGDAGRDDLYGIGLVNAQAAIARLAAIMGPSCPVDIADDAGTPLPPFGPGGGTNTGVNEGDYNAFFAGFFDALGYCDIADDAGIMPASSGTNTGVNEGDYNAFFQNFFAACQ